MEAETLFYVIAISALVVAAIIELNHLSKDSETVKKNNLPTFLFRVSMVIILILPVFSKFPDYNLVSEQQYWYKHSLPEIDTLMQVDCIMFRAIYYKSFSKNSIRHDSKTIQYDLFD